jgi:hypothetical protein
MEEIRPHPLAKDGLIDSWDDPFDTDSTHIRVLSPALTVSRSSPWFIFLGL